MKETNKTEPNAALLCVCESPDKGLDEMLSRLNATEKAILCGDLLRFTLDYVREQHAPLKAAHLPLLLSDKDVYYLMQEGNLSNRNGTDTSCPVDIPHLHTLLQYLSYLFADCVEVQQNQINPHAQTEYFKRTDYALRALHSLLPSVPENQPGNQSEAFVNQCLFRLQSSCREQTPPQLPPQALPHLLKPQQTQSEGYTTENRENQAHRLMVGLTFLSFFVFGGLILLWAGCAQKTVGSAFHP